MQHRCVWILFAKPAVHAYGNIEASANYFNDTVNGIDGVGNAYLAQSNLVVTKHFGTPPQPT